MPKVEYKIFSSKEMVARPEVDEIISLAMKKKKNIFILEGDRGAGKTFALLNLYRHYLQEPRTKTFFIGLFPYEAPEFSKQDNIWLSSNTKFAVTDIPNLLKKITNYLKITFIESLDPENQREYLAKQLAQRASGEKTVLLVDSFYECNESARKQIENNILTPLLSSSEVTIIISGRGKRPIWAAPEFREATYITLATPDGKFIKEQLMKMGSAHTLEWKKIADWSGGCPLIVRILGKSDQVSLAALDEAVDILIQDALKESLLPEYPAIRKTLQKLALLIAPFREIDVAYYLFGETTTARAEANQRVQGLLESGLLEWDDSGSRRGNRINQTITHPLQILVESNPVLFEQYKHDWDKSVENLVKTYPSVKRDEYHKMLMNNE